MKKYLSMVLAIAISGVFAGCHEEEISGSLIEQKKIAFEDAFVKAFGQPDPTHNWGFLMPDEDITRVADPRGNMWTSEGWNVPPVITDAQKNIVRQYFQQNTPLGYNDPGWSNFWIQQVYKGGTKTTDGSKTTEKYKIGNGDTVTGGDHMDHLCSKSANGVEDHIYDFNNSDNNDWEGRMLMRSSSTYSFGYINSNATAIHYDKAALVSWRVIAQWAVEKGLETSVEESVLNDGWNRSYMGFDWEQLVGDDVYKKGALVNGVWDPNAYATFEFEGETYRFLIANANEMAYDETEPTYHGKKNITSDADLTDDLIRDLLSKGYLPYSDTKKDWIKLSTGADGYYSDWIVTLTQASNSAIAPQVKTVTTGGYYRIYQDVLESGRVMCEDLAGASGNLDDLDYNDVVFDAVSVHEYKLPVNADGSSINGATAYDDAYFVTVRLMAAGGTIPVTMTIGAIKNEETGKYEGGQTFNVHSELEDPTTGYIMINTLPNTEEARKEVNMAQVMSADPVTLTYTDEDGHESNKFYSTNNQPILLSSIRLDVLYDNVSTELANSGAAPLKFKTPLGTAWARERKRINWAYPGFPEWVADKTKDWVWENNNVPNSVSQYLAENLVGLNEADFNTVSERFQNNSSSKGLVNATSTMAYPSTTDITLFSFVSTNSSPGYLCPAVGGDAEEVLLVNQPANLAIGSTIRVYGVSINGWEVKCNFNDATFNTYATTGCGYIDIPVTKTLSANDNLVFSGKNFTITYVTLLTSGATELWKGSNVLGNWDYNSRVEISKDKLNNVTKDTKFKIDVTFDNNWQIKVRTINSENLKIPAWNHQNTVQTGMNGVSTNSVEFSPGTDEYANMIKSDGLIIFGTNCTVTKLTME